MYKLITVIFLTHYINQANRILRNYFPTYFFGEEYLCIQTVQNFTGNVINAVGIQQDLSKPVLLIIIL